ncbi:hypothetical protein [Dehalococcoides mccartyi]|jgi:hypothetical protein|uniref:hypothetical protein n=1 Tax=Dehalococcoides mccartyi TaxID=61435 RepID=UPI0006BD5CCA|nr:hypothetical protein [Dehalococcoides mccartyi]BAS31226.1 hypothetical protein IBK_0151 [Dehalococcoides mccartyi IBARAKI]
MKYQIRKSLTETQAWAASSEKQITLPNEGAITRIVLHYILTVTACLAADTNTQLAAYKAIQNLKIEGSVGGTYFGASGEQMGRLLHVINQVDFKKTSFAKGMTTNNIYGNLILHFGSRPVDAYGRDNPFDLTAFIPAQDESPNGLKLTISTTQAADICDTAIDISAGTFSADVYEVLGLPSMAGYKPMSNTEFYAHSANKSDLSDLHDVPTGCFLRRIFLLSQDDTAIASGGPLLADDEIAKVGLILPKENRRLIESNWVFLTEPLALTQIPAMTAAGAVTKPINQAITGVGLLDLREFANPDYGLDLRGYQTGDIKLGLTIQNYAVGDDTIIYYDAVQPYAGRR